MLFGGCGDYLDDKVSDLVNGKNKWIRATPSLNYTYTICINCIYHDSNKRVMVNVRKGKVVSVKELGNIKESQSTEKFKTMEWYFKYIFMNIKREQQEKDVSISAIYNEELGYPDNIKYKRLNVIDGSAVIEISDVKVY